MKELLTLLCERLERDRPVALATVIAHQGSTPRGAGSRLLADQGGLVTGTVGGGVSEGQTLEACCAALQDGKARILDFTLTGELAAQSDMICGGRLRVLVEPLFPSGEHLRLFQAVLDAVCRDGAVLITDITDLSRLLRTAWIDNACIGAPLSEAILAKLSSAPLSAREASIVLHENRSYLIEPCLPPLRMIIAGGGHVARPTAQVAALAGFEVTVLDDRPEYAHPERFPWAAHTATVPGYLNCFAGCSPNSRTYIVIVTRGHLHDATVLSQALATQAGYIGMIGSKRKRAELYAALRVQGVSEEALVGVHCPIGLAIGAETPEEIAVSIVAECIAHWRKACPPENMPR